MRTCTNADTRILLLPIKWGQSKGTVTEMNDSNRSFAAQTAPLGIFLAIGLIVGGWVLGAQIKATRLSDRYVTVKGLVEHKVKSDLAIWPLSY